MFGLGFNPAKLETSCRLAVGRIKLSKNKKSVQLNAQRKEIAELLRAGKDDFAKIRVESIIREHLLMQAYEILELYLELVAVRAQLVGKNKEIPRDMIEAVSSVIYAAQRVSDMPELGTITQMLTSKYGREYAHECANDATCAKWQVNDNLRRCLIIEAPQPEEKLAALSDIAQEHKVEWDINKAARDMLAPAPLAAVQPMYGAPMAQPPPPPLLAAFGAPPQMAPPLGGGYPTVQQQFGDVHAAAAAAASAAAQAKVAADYAATFAHGAGGQAMLPPYPGGAVPSAYPDGLPPASAAPPAAAPGGGLPQGWAPAGSDHIQAAYDAAQGPPAKTAPSAPSTSSSALPPAAGGAAAGGGGIAGAQPLLRPATSSGSDGLPAPPGSSSGGQKQPDEYEDFQKRLEALKRF